MDSIIFDLDGTLWDSRETVVAAWNEVIRKHAGVSRELSSQDFKQTMGLQIKEIGKVFFPDLDEHQRELLLQACCKLEAQHIGQRGGLLYPGVEQILQVLSKKYKLYIVSNCQDGYIESFYQYHKLEKYFQDYENPGRTGLSKGENIALIMKRNQLEAPVYVGDTEGDLKGAIYAGVPFVFAKYGFGNVHTYDYAIETFEELLDIFA
ncbi:HAD family hydrolase [Microbacteriaceae bacterium 4G12]